MRRYEAGQEVVSGVKIISHIGAGGFGTVYKVSVPGGVEKALKIINLQGTQGVKEYNALKLIKKISHPNLVSIDSYWLRDLQGKLIDFSSDDSINAEKQSLELIILMGLGRMSLHDMLMQYLNQGKPGIPFNELIELMSDTAKAIDYLNEPHNLGLKEPVAIQHGDIKPGNILLVGNSVQVCDYGLAKAITTSKGVRTSVALFSPGYCSPEMNRNQPSYWSDQFSLAISYYELRTGKLPFNEEEEINAGIVSALGKLDFSGVPKAEREVLLKAANPIPNQRYPKCIDLINALRSTAYSSPRDSGPKPRTLDEILQPDSDVVPGYKLVQRISQGERDEFWKATTSAGKPFIIHVIREFRGALGNQLLQSLELLRQLDEHENLINLRNSWMIHSDGRMTPYIDAGSLENQTVALVSLLDNVDCTLEDYYNECLRKRATHGIPDHELLQFMMQVGKAVDYLTQLGHTEYLDLKPQTILLTKNKTVKLGISGLSKRLMSGSSSLTTDRLVNAFAPPELFDFEVGKHWNSNQYSLALTYYWLRSLGHLPFPADSSPKQIREYHLHGQLDFSDVPEREQNILYNATVLDPNQRFANCYDFVDAMQVAMGVSVPTYAEALTQQRISPRSTPIKLEQPTPPRPVHEERPTAHVERQQQITPPVIPSKKTPQIPTTRRSDPYSTINTMPALPQGFGYDETAQPYSEASNAEPLPGLTRVEAAQQEAPEEDRETDYRTVIRQTSDEKKRKRRRTRIIIGFAGMFVMGVIGLVVAHRFGLLAGLEQLVSGGTTPEGTSVRPTPIKPSDTSNTSLEKLVAEIDSSLAASNYDAAWKLTTQSKQSEVWVRQQQEKISEKLSSNLKKEIQSLVEKEEYDKADKAISDLVGKHGEKLPINWKQDQLAWIKGKKDASTASNWSGKWSDIQKQLKGLDSLDSLPAFQTKLNTMIAEAPPGAEKTTATALLESVKGLIIVGDSTQTKKDPEALLSRLNQFDKWKATAHSELMNAGIVKEIPKGVIKDTQESFLKVDSSQNLMKFGPLLKAVQPLAETKDQEWIKAGLLEIAAQDISTLSDEDIKQAKAFDPKSPYGRYAKAASLSKEMSSDTLKLWQEVYPPKNENKDGANEVRAQFRKEFSEKRITSMLNACRDKEKDRLGFSSESEKQKQALTAVKLLLNIGGEQRSDALLLAEQAILEDELTPENQGKSLKAFRSTNNYKEKLEKAHKDQISQILGNYPIDSTSSLSERLFYISNKLNELSVGARVQEKIPGTLVKGAIIPLAEHLEKLDISSAGEDKQVIGAVCSIIGKDIAINLKSWREHFAKDQDALALSMKMLQFARAAKGNDIASTAALLAFCRFNTIDPELTENDLKTLEQVEDKVDDIYVNLGKCYLLIARMEAAAGNAMLNDVEKQLDGTIALLKDNDFMEKRFKCRMMLQKSNVQLRRAHYLANDLEKERMLREAFDLVKSIGTAYTNFDIEQIADMKGIILEDQAMLLNKPTFKEAIKEYDNALLGHTGIQIRSKALLHKARCNYRWGQFLQEEGDKSQSRRKIQLTIEEMNEFLNDGSKRPLLQIEAHYYRGLANMAFAMELVKSDQSSEQKKSVEYLKKGIDDMDKALSISKASGISAFIANILMNYIENTLVYADDIRDRYKNIYADYSADDDFKFCINVLDEVSRKHSDRSDYVNFLKYRLTFYKNEINTTNADSPEIQKLLQDSESYRVQCIAESKKMNNILLLVCILEQSYMNYFKKGDYLNAYKVSLQLCKELEGSSYSDDYKALRLSRAAIVSWQIYIKDPEKNNSYKMITSSLLSQIVSQYYFRIDAGHKDLSKSQVFSNFDTVVKKMSSTEKQELLDKLKEIESKAQNVSPPNKVVSELIKKISS